MSYKGLCSAGKGVRWQWKERKQSGEVMRTWAAAHCGVCPAVLDGAVLCSAQPSARRKYACQWCSDGYWPWSAVVFGYLENHLRKGLKHALGFTGCWLLALHGASAVLALKRHVRL